MVAKKKYMFRLKKKKMFVWGFMAKKIWVVRSAFFFYTLVQLLKEHFRVKNLVKQAIPLGKGLTVHYLVFLDRRSLTQGDCSRINAGSGNQPSAAVQALEKNYLKSFIMLF